MYFIFVGVLASHPSSRDVHIHNFSLTFHGVELLADTKLELNTGRRYGLVGLNGSGTYYVQLLITHTMYINGLWARCMRHLNFKPRFVFNIERRRYLHKRVVAKWRRYLPVEPLLTVT